LFIVKAGKVGAYDDDKVGKDENGAFEVIALTFPVHVGEEEDAEDDCDSV
jgi:hypothetical protein